MNDIYATKGNILKFFKKGTHRVVYEQVWLILSTSGP